MFLFSSYLVCPEWFYSLFSTDLSGSEAKIKSVETFVHDLKVEALFKEETSQKKDDWVNYCNKMKKTS